MKVIFKDFNYKGEHIDKCVFDMPQVKEFDKLIQEKLIDYVTHYLDFLKEKKAP